MPNKFDEVREAVREAQTTMDAVDSVAGNMAGLLRGRLRHVRNTTYLAQLKKELSKFNAHTGRWSD